MWYSRRVLMMPSGISHSPCPSHTHHASITFSLLSSCFACIQMESHSSNSRPKVANWAQPNWSQKVLHASSHILEISLANVNNLKSPWLTWSSCERPMWLFLIMLLVIGPWYGLGLVDALELGLVGVNAPCWCSFFYVNKGPMLCKIGWPDCVLA